MASLYFSYAAMNAGKSTILLQAAHNYDERGMKPMLFTAAIDNRGGEGQIWSRLEISKNALTFETSTDIFEQVKKSEKPDVVMLDEAQFLTREQVWQLARIADELGIPVLAYGLRTDFQGELFAGSAALLAIADHMTEIKTICWCGRKATMVLRVDENGNPVLEGEQVAIGAEEAYISLCRKHWLSGNISAPQSK